MFNEHLKFKMTEKACTSSFYYPVDISTTVFSYSCAVQYHTISHNIAWVLLHGLGLCGILATTMCFNYNRCVRTASYLVLCVRRDTTLLLYSLACISRIIARVGVAFLRAEAR